MEVEICIAMMTKFERVQAALQGEHIDRVPASLWGHNFLKEWSPEGLAEAMLDFHRKYDWDYMKVNPRASYHVEDWGARYEPTGDPNRGPTFVEGPIRVARDWARLWELDPNKGVLGEHIKALELIRDGLAGDAPFVQTVFSPLGVAKYLVGNREDVIRAHMREDPNSLHHGLSVIARTFAAYVDRCLAIGVHGIFFATTGWASRDALDEDDYVVFGKRYDLEVLEALGGRGFFNVIHNCGERIYFRLLSFYPCQAINWAAALPGNPSLEEGHRVTDKAVIGGVGEKSALKDGTPAEVANEVHEALRQTQKTRFLLGPGCSIPPNCPDANIWAVKGSVL